MGIISNWVERNEIKAGDHIYTYIAVFAYSHHLSPLKFLLLFFIILSSQLTLFAAIFVRGSKVVHFTPDCSRQSSTKSPSNPSDELFDMSSPCQTFPNCGFRQQPDSGVVLTCLDCFLRSGSLYRFEYGVTPSVFLSKVRGGTCTTGPSDPSQSVIHRAMYLLQNGFGNYDVFRNNCEDFAIYCKTGLLIMDRSEVGRSGQASSVVGAPLAALLSSPLKLLLPSPIGVATVTAGMYCMSRYATDIGVRSDVINVAVEDLAVNLGWGPHTNFKEVKEDETGSSDQLIVL